MVQEEYREQIHEYETERDFIFFMADQVWARILKTRRYEDSDGNKRVELVMVPDPGLMDKYNLDYDRDLPNGNLTRDYLDFYIVVSDPGSQRISFGLCDFYGEEAPQLAYHMKRVFDELTEARRKIKTLTLTNIKTNRDIEEMAVNPLKRMRIASDLKAEQLGWLKKLTSREETEEDERRR